MKKLTSNQPLTAAVLISAVNLLLLMPAANHPNAGAFTQALPIMALVLTLILVYIGMKHRNTPRA